MIKSKDIITEEKFKHLSHYDFENFIENYENPNRIIILEQNKETPII